jgi:hypothetical protein
MSVRAVLRGKIEGARRRRKRRSLFSGVSAACAPVFYPLPLDSLAIDSLNGFASAFTIDPQLNPLFVCLLDHPHYNGQRLLYLRLMSSDYNGLPIFLCVYLYG